MHFQVAEKTMQPEELEHGEIIRNLKQLREAAGDQKKNIGTRFLTLVSSVATGSSQIRTTSYSNVR